MELMTTCPAQVLLFFFQFSSLLTTMICTGKLHTPNTTSSLMFLRYIVLQQRQSYGAGFFKDDQLLRHQLMTR
ncbi:hypothetical protein RchiOBHm_Chr5g0021861 [Rosa chinensis]|uniref:Uncharacterized protein n=1 Tax=Rosa chinensis TaxID=74649 RepID=A0A2P6Q7N9_ROSCH|nr:hypothetical protein RchiOBHm_Chr5g0021861 [Rosa chinensis]